MIVVPETKDHHRYGGVEDPSLANNSIYRLIISTEERSATLFKMPHLVVLHSSPLLLHVCCPAIVIAIWAISRDEINVEGGWLDSFLLIVVESTTTPYSSAPF